MATASALYATFMMGTFSLFILLNKLSIWNQLPAKDRFWTSIATAYGTLLLGSGWLYACLKTRAIGCVHGVLMLVLAGIGGYSGFATLMDRSFMGGRGPDANPVAGIIYGFGLLVLVLGSLCAVFGAGVLKNVLHAKRITSLS